MRHMVGVGVGAALLAVGGAAGFGAAQVLDDESAEPAGITEAEQDRLVDACVAANSDAAPGCVAWVAEMVAWADEEDMSNTELSEVVAERLADATEEAQQEADEAERRRSEQQMREFCDWVGGENC